MNQFEAAQIGDLKWYRKHDTDGTLPDLSVPDDFGVYVHEYASKAGHCDLVKFLLDECSQRESIDIFRDSSTSISWAIEHGHSDVFEYFLEKTTEIQHISILKTAQGVLPHVAGAGFVDIFRLLFTLPKSTEILDLSFGDNLICRLALSCNQLSVMRYLVEECPQRSQVDLRGCKNMMEVRESRWWSARTSLATENYFWQIIKTQEALGEVKWNTFREVCLTKSRKFQTQFPEYLEQFLNLPENIRESLLTSSNWEQLLSGYLTTWSQSQQKQLQLSL